MVLMVNNIDECRAVKNFIDTYDNSGTINSYKTYLSNYFNWIGINPEEYIKSERDFSQDIMEYVKYRTDKGAPLSRKQELVGIKQFLEHYEIDIKNKIWKKIRNRNKVKTASTKDDILTNSELKKVLQYTDIKGRAIFLLLSSSGIRIKELVSITWDDINLNEKEIYISSELAKNGIARYTFFTDEAKDALLEWKKVSLNYNKRAKARAEKCLKIKKAIDEDKIFPYSPATIGIMWNELLKKAGEEFCKRDKRTNRRIYHLYTLRKFFHSTFDDSPMPEGILKNLMGHSGYLNSNYSRIPKRKIKKSYEENCKLLSVFSELYKAEEFMKPKIERHETTISSLAGDNERLKKQIIELKQQTNVSDLKSHMLEMEKKVDVLMVAFKNSDFYKIEKNGLSRELKLPNGEKVEDILQGSPGSDKTDDELLKEYELLYKK